MSNKYRVNSRHNEEIGGKITEINSTVVINSMAEANSYLEQIVKTFTEYSENKVVRCVVLVLDDQDEVAARMFYNYENGELMSFNKDKGYGHVHGVNQNG